MDRIQFSKPEIGSGEIDAIVEVMNSGYLAAGPQTEAFEKEFADYVGVKYAIFTSSGTAALKLAYKYFREEVGATHYSLANPNTYNATYSAAEEIGLKPTKSPIDLFIKKSVWVVVHYGGVKVNGPCHLEDSAHRIEPNDPLVGDVRIYSFYATKNMTTGAGGMLVTNDKDIYDRCRLYWSDGLRDKNDPDAEVEVYSGGYDGNDIAAAIGRVQLKRLPKFNERRNEIVLKYNEAFGRDWKGNHLYPISKDKGLIKFLDKHGIAAKFFYNPGGYVCLPLYPSLTDKQVEYIIRKVKEYGSI